ncbi:MAG: hypothetical protein NZ772_00750 [Cyanobacteria bacterium]|nr:hypothetical protein [Cyanobacteriota bacterium]MDW8199925.1 hypothetical protein [Cyanobacteriota bacterium SKYGB_h_bin112]
MMLLNVPFLLSGLTAILILGEVAILTCTRLEPSQVACKLTNGRLLGKQVTQIPAGKLQRADVSVAKDDDDGDTYRVVLVTETGTIPLTWAYSSGQRGKRQKAEQINAFLANPEQTTLTVRQDDRWFAYLVGGIFTLIGAGATWGTVTAKSLTTLVFDKLSGHLSMTLKSWVASETKQIPLRDIRAAEVVEGTDSDGDKTYSTQLTLRSGNPIRLPVVGGSEDHYKIADAINTFLGLNPKSR